MSFRGAIGVAIGLLVASCAGARRGGNPRVYAQFDSTSSACVQNPVLCAVVAGAPESGSVAQAVAVGASLGTVAAIEVLDLVTQKKIEDVLKECADRARSEVIIKHYGRGSPTPEDCAEKVPVPGREDVTRAMLLGEEMHRVASKCVDERLGKALPGRYSLEQRYRFDPATKTTTPLTPDEVEAIKRAGRWSELKGTIVPDVVIHKGDPRYAQAVYDFKFRCVNVDDPPVWRKYETGPYEGTNQGALYREAFGQEPHLVAPRLGVF